VNQLPPVQLTTFRSFAPPGFNIIERRTRSMALRPVQFDILRYQASSRCRAFSLARRGSKEASGEHVEEHMFDSSPGTARICGAIPRKPQNRACANCKMRDIYFRFRTNLTKALHGPPLVVYTISRAVQKVSRLFAKEAEGIGRSSLASRREGGSGGGYAARVSKARWDAAKRIRRHNAPRLSKASWRSSSPDFSGYRDARSPPRFQSGMLCRPSACLQWEDSNGKASNPRCLFANTAKLDPRYPAARSSLVGSSQQAPMERLACWAARAT
jgi:hypothetical protein